jgi:hypothetical protein
MNFKIVAIKPFDGRALVERSDGMMYLVRPPYLESAVEEIDLKSNGNACFDIEFESPDDDLKSLKFPDWKSLFRTVRKILISKRKEMGQSEHSLDDANEVFLSMPPSGIKVAFDLITDEFIPKSQFSRARRLLKNLEETKAVKKDPDLKKMLDDLKEKCKKERSISKCFTKIVDDPKPKHIENTDYPLKNERTPWPIGYYIRIWSSRKRKGEFI